MADPGGFRWSSQELVEHASARFLAAMAEHGGPIVMLDAESAQTPLELGPAGGWELVAYYEDKGRTEATWQGAGGLWLEIGSYGGSRRVMVWAGVAGGREKDIEHARRVVAQVEERVVKPAAPSDPAVIPVSFWYRAAHGPQCQVREITAPSWDEVNGNYSAGAREALGRLMDAGPGSMNGRIGVLSGPPGTGKTTAVRALARSWKKWCSTTYIVDPEQFFGSAEYMLGVILSNGPRIEWDDDDDEDEDDKAPWRLIIVEDAEEFLVPDGKERVGQGLARLLNVGDGMVGQGLRILLLFTTNASLFQINKALVRPGRCFADIEVPKLSGPEAASWAAEHDVRLKLRDGEAEATIAELYEMQRKDAEQVVRTPAGAGASGMYL